MLTFSWLVKFLVCIMQGVLVGLLLFPLLFKHVLRIWEQFTDSSHSEVRSNDDRGRSALFYVSLTFMLIVIVPSWIQLVQDFPAHPLLWYCILHNLIFHSVRAAFMVNVLSYFCVGRYCDESFIQY